MSDRILVLIPHPDDEVVGCATAISRRRAAGQRFWGLFLTTGVPPRDALWPWRRQDYAARVARRRSEALAAAAALGLSPAAFQPWPSRRLKRHLAEADALIARTIAEHRIDALWVPAWEGGHQDHDAANFLAAGYAASLPVIEFAEYNFAGGTPRAQRFIETTGEERQLVLSPRERAAKRELLALYRSERGNLRHIGCACESLRPLAPYDYGSPPHSGLLFYQRYQWLPWRHPRVDFEHPRAVCAALAAYRPSSGQPATCRLQPPGCGNPDPLQVSITDARLPHVGGRDRRAQAPGQGTI